LRPPRRSAGNYREYGEADLARLRQLRAFRAAGLTIDDIRAVLAQPKNDAASVLRRRLVQLGAEAEKLREQQFALARLLQGTANLRSNKMITKEKWTDIMRGAGFSDADMWRWHSQFEKSAPEEHDEFLRFLHIPQGEIAGIRKRSREVAESGTGS
jgi:DNA-binding transcriptional MerR regulator